MKTKKLGDQLIQRINQEGFPQVFNSFPPLTREMVMRKYKKKIIKIISKHKASNCV